MSKKKRPGGGSPGRRGKKGSPRGPGSWDGQGLPDPLTMEGFLRDLMRQQGMLDEQDPAAAKAQQLVQQAYQASNGEARLESAQRALEVDPDCADAYVCLAELAPTAEDALPEWEQGVAAGMRVLGGPDATDQYEGHFWGLLQTRPYMRARLGLAQCLWSLRRQEEAVAHCRELLRLNPNDNQGVRYVLSSYLCEMGQDDQWQQLLEQYPDDASAEWHFGRALLAYRRQGDTDASRDLLHAAHAANPYVAEYLVGNRVPPAEPPPYVALGEDSEAHSYAGAFLPGWRGTPGAASWVRKILQIAPPGGQREPRRASWTFLKGSVGDLPLAAGEVWQVDLRQTRLGVADRNAPAMRTLAMANADEGQIVALQPWDSSDKPAPREILIAVLEAMREPQFGEPRRPEAIQVLRKAYRHSWGPKLQEIGVRCELIADCDFIDGLMDRMEEMGASTQLSEDERQQLAEGVADLPQEPGEVWQVASRKLATWITDRGEPQRPWATLVASPGTMCILGQNISLDPPTAEMLWETLLTAMVSPAIGPPHLPEGIQVTSDHWRDALLPHLSPLGVSCETCDRLDQMEEILEDLSSSLNGGQQLAAMIDTPGVTLRHVGGLFAAAAEFYQTRPWRNVLGDAAIGVRCDKFQAARWYAVVMGQSGMTYGLAMYEDLEVLQALLREDPDAQRRNSGMSLMYSEAFEISVRDLDAAEREDWPVAGPEAYPLVLRINPGMAVRPPLAWELEILEGCLRAVPPFLARAERTPARMTVPVSTGELTLELTWTG
ncbi:MAG TPA: hypothetical protein PLF81_01295 [Candidatus Anammoximicrobium sp.]|nr:hypothetical protein [Candidatus Anammoximicrobium sp.]